MVLFGDKKMVLLERNIQGKFKVWFVKIKVIESIDVVFVQKFGNRHHFGHEIHVKPAFCLLVNFDEHLLVIADASQKCSHQSVDVIGEFFHVRVNREHFTIPETL